MRMQEKEYFIEWNSEANAKQNRLMTFGLFQGSKVRIIKDDTRNQMLILGIGNKRIAMRKEELTDVKFVEV